MFGLSGFNFGAEAMSERPEGYSELRGLLLCAQDREKDLSRLNAGTSSSEAGGTAVSSTFTKELSRYPYKN